MNYTHTINLLQMVWIKYLLHCVSLGVIAGILMPHHLLLHMWPIKACCLFIVCWHHCGQMSVWTYSMIQWIAIQIAYTM